MVVALCCPGPAGYTTWIDQLPGDTQVNSARLWQKPDVRRTFDLRQRPPHAGSRRRPPPGASAAAKRHTVRPDVPVSAHRRTAYEWVLFVLENRMPDMPKAPPIEGRS